MKCLGCGKEIDKGEYCKECREKLVSFYVNKIKSFIKAYDYKSALFQCGQALNIDPTSSELLELEGEINRKLSDYELCFSLGEENYNKGNYQKALEFYQKAFEINPLSQDLKMKIDMARISSQVSAVSQTPEEKEREEKEVEELTPPAWKLLWKTGISLLCVLIVLFFAFRYFYISYLHMDTARRLFERISSGMHDSQYMKNQFVKDYEVLEREFRKTFYACQAKLLYEDLYQRTRSNKKVFVQLKQALQEAGSEANKNTSKERKPSFKKASLSQKAIAKDTSASSHAAIETKGTASRLIKEARTYFKRGLYKRCLQILEKALLAASEEEKTQIKSFIAKVSDVIYQRRNRYLVLIQEAHRLEEEGDFRRSLNYYYEALALRPHSKYCRMRINYIKKKFLFSFFREYFARASFFWKGLFRSKDKIFYLYRLSIKKYEERQKFGKAASLYNNLALIKGNKSYRRMAMLELELNAIEREVKKGEVSFQLLIKKAIVYYQMRNFSGADKILRTLKLMDPPPEYYILVLSLQAELWEERKEYFKAEKALRNVLKKFPSYFLQQKLAIVLYKQHRVDEALSFLERIPQESLGLESLTMLANIYLELGKKQAAHKVLEQLKGKNIRQIYQLYKLNPLSFEYFSPSYRSKIESIIYTLPSLFLRVGERAEALRFLSLSS